MKVIIGFLLAFILSSSSFFIRTVESFRALPTSMEFFF